MPDWAQSATVVWPIALLGILVYWRVVRPWMADRTATAAWRQRVDIELSTAKAAASAIAAHEKECGVRHTAMVREIGELRTQVTAAIARLDARNG